MLAAVELEGFWLQYPFMMVQQYCINVLLFVKMSHILISVFFKFLFHFKIECVCISNLSDLLF